MEDKEVAAMGRAECGELERLVRSFDCVHCAVSTVVTGSSEVG